jgi:hypothetical protein
LLPKFAALLHFDVGTLRNCEQGRREPTGPAKALLAAIRKDPALILGTAVCSGDETEAALRRAAVRATGESLVIEPADTRIARLATGGYPPTQPQNIFGAEVLEPKSKKALLVFYVNKPCHLSGQMPLEGSWSGPRAPYELDIPRAGLTWVTSEAIDGKVLLTLVPQPKEFVYVIFDDR